MTLVRVSQSRGFGQAKQAQSLRCGGILGRKCHQQSPMGIVSSSGVPFQSGVGPCSHSWWTERVSARYRAWMAWSSGGLLGNRDRTAL